MFSAIDSPEMVADDFISSARTTEDLFEAFKYVHGFFVYGSRRSLIDKMIEISFREGSFADLDNIIAIIAWEKKRYGDDLSIEHLEMDEDKVLFFYFLVFKVAMRVNVMDLKKFVLGKLKAYPWHFVMQAARKNDRRLAEVLKAMNH
jgi:hypothetical protein